MNTDFDRIRAYYSRFDEWERLSAPSGMLEFEVMKRILCSKLARPQNVLDLGGGPGRYTFFLAEMGHHVHLADISPKLIDEARMRCQTFLPEIRNNVIRIDIVNALDLSIYPDNSFDVVLLFGPLYHLGQTESDLCLKGIRAKLRPNGALFAIYIPYETGIRNTLDRAFFAPNQVDYKNLFHVAETGQFSNNSMEGFQEAYFPKTNELIDLFNSNGYAINSIRSIRGIAFGYEEDLFKRRDTDPDFYLRTLDLIDNTAYFRSIVDTCGHALIVAENQKCAT